MATLHQARGTLTLILGAMFAGKTTEMIVRVLGLSHAPERRAVIVLYAEDDRYNVGDSIATHNYPALPALASAERVQVIRASTLADARQKMGALGGTGDSSTSDSSGTNDSSTSDDGKLPDIIGIDEGQMFPDLEHAGMWADRGACVFVAALNSDFRRAPFPGVAQLAPDDVIFRRAECTDCKERPAAFTFRMSNDDALLVIGGAESYRALCRACYIAARAAQQLAASQQATPQ